MRPVLVVGLLTLILSGGPARAEAKDKPGSMRSLVQARTGLMVPGSSGEDAEPALQDSLAQLLQGGLTAETAVRIALLNNRGLRAEIEEIGISRADFGQALLPKNPSVLGEVRFDGGQRPGDLVVMQDLGSILLTPVRRRAAGAMLERANFMAAHVALGVVREARAAFYSMQAAEQVRRFWEQTSSGSRAAAELAVRQYRAGNIAELDLESQQALYEQTKIELAKSQLESMYARERLNRVMGASGRQTEWEAAGELPDVPADAPPLEGLESVAIAQRFDLAAADAEARALARAVPLARFSQFPELRVGVHAERAPEGTTAVGPAIEVSVPLFDRGQHMVDRAQAQLRQARDRQTSLAIEIRSEVRAVRARLMAAHQLVGYYRDTVLPRRARIVEHTQREYNFMLVGVYQLLQAKEGEIHSQREFVEARRDYWVSVAELEFALGGAMTSPGVK